MRDKNIMYIMYDPKIAIEDLRNSKLFRTRDECQGRCTVANKYGNSNYTPRQVQLKLI